MTKKTKYEWITTSDAGFVRYLVANILPHGYRFYMAGHIKPTTSVEHFDELMEKKYGYKMSRSSRWRRKAAVGPAGVNLGLANLHYLRRERFYLLIATKGVHPFFEEHTSKKVNRKGEVITRTKYYRDIHRDPLFFDGYSIRVDCEGGYRPKRIWLNPEVPEWDGSSRVRVRIAQEVYLTMRQDLLARARSSKWDAKALEGEIRKIPYLRYAPIRQQLRDLVFAMNRERAKRGIDDRLDPKKCISRVIPAISPFASTREIEEKAA